MRVAASHQAEARKIAAELAAIARSGMVLPASITERRTRCGHRNCACRADPPRLHGPHWQWTRKVAAKTICRWLSPEQHHDCQAWNDNDLRLRELLTRLEALGAAALEADPRWQRTTWQAPAASGKIVWAVGYAGLKTLIQRWNGAAWTRVTSPSPPGADDLAGVTAISARDAWAVAQGNGQILIVHWSGSAWRQQAS